MKDMNEQMAEQFDAAADRYDEDVKRHRYFASEWIARHAHELEDLHECRVLDLGCGTGLNVKVLCEQRAEIRADGVDLSPKMIERARATGRYDSLYIRDLHHTLSDISSDTYDLVIVFATLELLSYVDVCLSECRRILKVKGTLWATFGRFECEDEGSPPRRVFRDGLTITGYSAAEILNLMANLDMRVTALETVTAYITPAGFARPYYVLRAKRTQQPGDAGCTGEL